MKKIFASSVAELDSNVYTGGGTDVTEQLQAVLDLALTEQGVHLVMDGAALVRGLKVHSNTVIECLGSDCGFFMADYTDRPILTNGDWSMKEIRNKDITIIGGTYNHNCTKQQHDVPASEYPNPECGLTPSYKDIHRVYLMEFYGVENFKLQNVCFRNQRTYTFTMGNFKNVILEDSYIDMAEHVHPSNQDGFHLFGPGQFLTMRNLRGCTGDDFINLAPDEMDGTSSITDVLIDGICFDNVCQGIRMLSWNQGMLDRVTVRNVTGTYRTFGFSINPFFSEESFGRYGSFYFENINLRQIKEYYHYTPLTFFQAGGDIECMVLKNVCFHSPVRNNVIFDIGTPFFYKPDELMQEEIEKFSIDLTDYIEKDWMPPVLRPCIHTFIIDGLTVVTDEKCDDCDMIELRYSIDNVVLKNIQVFRDGEAKTSGRLVRMAKEASVKNMLVEDIFAEKLENILYAEEGHRIELLKVDNVLLRDGSRVLAVEGADIKALVKDNVQEISL